MSQVIVQKVFEKTRKEMTARDVMEHCDLSYDAVSQAIRRLKKWGIIVFVGTRKGKIRGCSNLYMLREGLQL